MLCVGGKAQKACGWVYCRSLGKMPLVPTRKHNLPLSSPCLSLYVAHKYTLHAQCRSHTHTHTQPEWMCERDKDGERQQTVWIAPIKVIQLRKWWMWRCGVVRIAVQGSWAALDSLCVCVFLLSGPVLFKVWVGTPDWKQERKHMKAKQSSIVIFSLFWVFSLVGCYIL